MLSQSIISVVVSLFDGGRGPEAMQLLKAAGGQDSYSGYAGQTSGMGFTTFGGSMGHNQMSLSPGAFSQPLVGMFAAPYISSALAPMNTINHGLVLAQNSAQVKFGGYQDAMSAVLSETLEKSAQRLGYKGDMDWGVAANFLTASAFNSPLSADFLGFLSATGLDADERVREGLLGAGVSQLSLNKYGLSSSLLHSRETQVLEQNLRSAAENEDIGIGDALAAATSVNDRRLGLNVSDKFTGFGDSEAFAKLTEDLKRAKDLTGQSNIQTLSLLAEVYDNVIEGIIPQLGEFTDRMMILERQGVSVHEYSATVRNLRQKFRSLGIEDTNLVPDLVAGVYESRDDIAKQHWAAGDKNYSSKIAEARRFEQATVEATSKEMSLANLLMVMTGSRTKEEFDALIADPDSIIDNPDAKMIAEAFKSGDTGVIVSMAADFASGNRGDTRTQYTIGRNPQNVGAVFGSDAWGRYVRGAQPSFSPHVTELLRMADQEEATKQFYEYMALANAENDELPDGWTKEGNYYRNTRTGKKVALGELGYLRDDLRTYKPFERLERKEAKYLDERLSDPRRWIDDEYGDASKWQSIMHSKGVDTVEQAYGIFMSAAMADTTDENEPLLANTKNFLRSAVDSKGDRRFSDAEIEAGEKAYTRKAGSNFTEEKLKSLTPEGSKENALISMLRETDRVSKRISPTPAESVSKNDLQMLAANSRLGQGRGIGLGGDDQTSEIIRLLRQLVINTDEDSKVQTNKVEKLATD